MTNSVTLTGGCLCGDVRYSVFSNNPNAWICSCNFCTGHTASPYLSMHCFSEEVFALEAGDVKTHSHVSTTSGRKINLRFCVRCGTYVFMTLDRYPGSLNVYTATFDEPSKLPFGSSNLRYNHAGTALSGTILPAGFEVFEGHFAPVSGPRPEPEIHDAPVPINTSEHGEGPHKGGCLCGKVRFEFDDDPHFIVVCSCRYCQKILGSGVNHECLVEPEKFRVTKGAPLTYVHRSGASGKMVEHRFCGDCGTSVFLTGERFRDVGVFRGALDRPNRIGLRSGSCAQIFLDDATPSGMVIAGIESFGQHKRAPDDTILEGKVHKHHWRIGDGVPHWPG